MTLDGDVHELSQSTEVSSPIQQPYIVKRCMSIMIGNTKYPTLIIVASLVMVSFSGCTGLGSNVPNAKISADQTEINLGETVNFDARESTTPSPTIIDEFQWDFGDGGSKTTKQGITSYTFVSSGYHDVEVTVLNDDGEIDRDSISIFVNAPPTIVIEMPTFIKSGETATLDASQSFDPEGAGIEVIWDYNIFSDSNNDGDPSNDADSTLKIAELKIDQAGNRTGSVTVVDDKGAVSTTIWNMMVVSRVFNIVWEEQIVEANWNGYLEQGESVVLEHEPGLGGRVIQLNSTLTLSRELIPIMLPEDNFTFSLDMESGWSTFASTSQDNITENSSASIDRGEMNSYPDSGYTLSADSKESLEEQLLNQAGERFGQGTWTWIITADQCDPDLPVDGVDPDQGNDWELTVTVVVMVLRISEVGP